MHHSSSESSIDKNKFPSVINLYAHDNLLMQNKSYNGDCNYRLGNISNMTNDDYLEMNVLYTIKECNQSSQKINTESSEDESENDRLNTSSTSTSSEEGLVKKIFKKCKFTSQSFLSENGHESGHLTDDIRSLKTQPNCPSSPSMWSSSTSGKPNNILSKKVMIKESYPQDIGYCNHSLLNTRTGLCPLAHGLRQNNRAMDSGISNTSPDTLSSIEFYQRNIEECGVASKYNRLINNFPLRGTNIPPSILKHRRIHYQIDGDSLSNFRSVIYYLFSPIYIFLISIFTLVFTISDQRDLPGSKTILESSQVLQYTISILFLTVFHLTDCKGKSKRYSSIKNKFQDTYSNRCLMVNNYSSYENFVPTEVLNIDGWKRIDQFNEVSSALFKSFGKLTILILGIASIIRNGIELATQIEIEQTNIDGLHECYSILVIIRSFLSLLFTVIQTYFLFLDYKFIEAKRSNFIIFGVIQMATTNINALLHNIFSLKGNIRIINLKEFVHKESKDSIFTSMNFYPSNVRKVNQSLCYGADLMGQVAVVSDTYLYPFSVQYNILSIVINLFLISSLFCSMNTNPPLQKSNSLKSIRKISSDAVRLRSLHCNKLTSINCSNTNKGFFIGLFTLFVSIISLIVLYIFSKKSTLKFVAMKISYLTEIFLTLITILISVVSLYHFRDTAILQYPRNGNKIYSVNRILMFISLFGGVYLYNISSILAWRTAMHIPSAPYAIISSLCNIIQGSIQTIYILLMLSRISLADSVSHRPLNKECISFIMMNNIGLWCLKVFMELQQNIVENIPEVIYGHVCWVLIKRISVSLTLLYQLDSVISLTVILKMI